MNKIASIGIVGNGNVASHFALFFLEKTELLKTIIVRDVTLAKTEQPNLANSFSDDYSQLSNCDLVIVAVKDAVLNEVIQKIPSDCIVACTSGSVGLNQLDRKENIGVFYPLQTFTKGKKIDVSSAPLLIESNDKIIEKQLIDFGKILFKQVEIMNSAQREKIHLAAVMVNNFVNHLYFQAADFLETHQLDFKLLLPLIQETAKKIETLSPSEAQTGPAQRKDLKIIEQQEKQLSGTKLEIYKLLTESILSGIEIRPNRPNRE